MRSHRIAANRSVRVALVGAVLVFGAGCSNSKSSVSGVCRIDYDLVEGEASERFDEIIVSADGRLVTRLVHDEGTSAVNRAIYYYFDDDGTLLVEAMDNGANGDIEARLDAQGSYGGVITPYAVDVDIQDGAIDAIQLSVALPTSMIGPWNPARTFFQVPCDQGEAVVEDNGDQVAVDLFIEGEETARTTMDIIRGPQDELQGWTVDWDQDGEPNDIAQVIYDPEGLVQEVRWLRPGQYLGETYVFGRYTYDTEGFLYAYEIDPEGDGEVNSRITYSSSCFSEPTGFEGSGGVQ